MKERPKLPVLGCGGCRRRKLHRIYEGARLIGWVEECVVADWWKCAKKEREVKDGKELQKD